ncbi:MAG: phage portal protein [Firmicutes bacterium]|nr:phage portal protein [Bacillota bacterium]
MELIAKAEVIGQDSGPAIPVSHRIDQDPFVGQYGPQILEPPLPLNRLVAMPEISNILNQCVEAMETNIDGFGYTLVPLVQLPKGEDLPKEALEERKRIHKFFKFCNPEISFTDIRRATRKDLETTGNAYWELLRNAKGELAGIVHVPAYTVRLTWLDPEYTDIKYQVLNEDNEYEELPFRKRFRRYVQLVGAKKVYWKEFGDPRPIDMRTGEVIKSDTKDAVPANEMLHFKIYSPRSAYGIPRWAGNLLSLLGSRAAEEINYLYFDNKSVPPLVVLVSGGHLAEGVRERIETYVEEQLKGRGNFHKILLLEAESADGTPLAMNAGKQVRIDIKPLAQLIQQDALFMKYDEANREKVRSAFRLPPLYVGLAKDFNRATAEEARDTAEAQVFGPERDAFDFTINHRIFPELGVRYWEFKTLSAPQENPDKESDILKKLGSWLTAREVRKLIEQVLHIDLAELDSDWLDEPLEVYLSKLKTGQSGSDQGADVEKFVKFLVEVRKRIEEQEHVA